MKKISKQLYEACEYLDLIKPQTSITQIAEQFGVDRHSISKHIQDYKDYKYLYEDEYYLITQEELEPVYYFLEHENEPILNIAKKFKIKPDTIKRRLAVLGQTYITRTKRHFNRSIFHQLETEEQAYWLGFILADGYINEERNFLKIKLQKSDENHLKKFAIFMQEEDENIIKYETGGAYTKNNLCVSIEFYSKELITDLKQYKLFQKKSGKEQPIDMPNESLQLAYLRGMIDGDGHIENGYFKYVGSLQSCEYIKNKISKYYNFNPNNKYIYPKETIYSLEIRNKDINSVIKKIYNGNIYLDRKYEIVQKF